MERLLRQRLQTYMLLMWSTQEHINEDSYPIHKLIHSGISFFFGCERGLNSRTAAGYRAY